MKPRDFLDFFKTKTGKLVIFSALFGAGLIIFSTLRQRRTPVDIITAPLLTNSVTAQPEVIQTVVRPMQVFHPPPPPPPTHELLTVSSTHQSSSTPMFTKSSSPPMAPPRQNVSLTPISLFADSTAGVSHPKKLSAIYAPFGRLIPCETVITVDSSSLETPVIGLVTGNVYYGGKLVIPAGTEVHGMAQTDHQRDRIAGGTSWTLVWQDGEEMELKAIVLDREFDNNTNQSGWGITDGSAGLRGELLKTDDYADIKLFAATFLSGAAASLTEKQQTIFGPINSPTLNNAPFAGAQAILQTYAQQILDSIEKNGFYVRVPSGTQFYLYIVQTIDRADATFGGAGLDDETGPQALTLPKR